MCVKMLEWALDVTTPENGTPDHDLLELYCGNGDCLQLIPTLSVMDQQTPTLQPIQERLPERLLRYLATLSVKLGDVAA